MQGRVEPVNEPDYVQRVTRRSVGLELTSRSHLSGMATEAQLLQRPPCRGGAGASMPFVKLDTGLCSLGRAALTGCGGHPLRSLSPAT